MTHHLGPGGLGDVEEVLLVVFPRLADRLRQQTRRLVGRQRRGNVGALDAVPPPPPGAARAGAPVAAWRREQSAAVPRAAALSSGSRRGPRTACLGAGRLRRGTGATRASAAGAQPTPPDTRPPCWCMANRQGVPRLSANKLTAAAGKAHGGNSERARRAVARERETVCVCVCVHATHSFVTALDRLMASTMNMLVTVEKNPSTASRAEPPIQLHRTLEVRTVSARMNAGPMMTMMATRTRHTNVHTAVGRGTAGCDGARHGQTAPAQRPSLRCARAYARASVGAPPPPLPRSLRLCVSLCLCLYIAVSLCPCATVPR